MTNGNLFHGPATPDEPEKIPVDRENIEVIGADEIPLIGRYPSKKPSGRPDQCSRTTESAHFEVKPKHELFHCPSPPGVRDETLSSPGESSGTLESSKELGSYDGWGRQSDEMLEMMDQLLQASDELENMLSQVEKFAERAGDFGPTLMGELSGKLPDEGYESDAGKEELADVSEVSLGGKARGWVIDGAGEAHVKEQLDVPGVEGQVSEPPVEEGSTAPQVEDEAVELSVEKGRTTPQVEEQATEHPVKDQKSGTERSKVMEAKREPKPPERKTSSGGLVWKPFPEPIVRRRRR